MQTPFNLERKKITPDFVFGLYMAVMHEVIDNDIYYLDEDSDFECRLLEDRNEIESVWAPVNPALDSLRNPKPEVRTLSIDALLNTLPSDSVLTLATIVSRIHKFVEEVMSDHYETSIRYEQDRLRFP